MNTSNTHLRKGLAAGILLSSMLCSSTAVLAATADDTPTYTLDTVIVTATRTEKHDINVPAATNVITDKDLKTTGASTIYEALERTPGFSSWSWGDNGLEYGLSASRTIIRGLDKGTLVMVNGNSVNLLNYNGLGGVMPEAVKKAEIVKGANSTLYGAEAIGGAVNVITKKGSDMTDTKLGVSYGNYLKNYTVQTGNGKFGLIFKRDYIGDVDRTSLDGITNSKKVAVDPYGLYNSGRNSLYLSADLSDKLNLNWSYSDSALKRPRYQSTGAHSVDYFLSDTRNNVNLQYDNKEAGLKSVLSFNKRRAYSDSYTYKTKKNDISERFNMYSINWDTQKEWKPRAGLDDLITGFTLSRENWYGIPAFDTKKNTYINSKRTSESLYASYAYQVSPKFTTTLGLRGQHIDDYAKTQNVLLPQFQTNYKLNDNTSWYVNIGKAFEVAPINSYFNKKVGDLSTVDPQQGWSYETGLKYINDRNAYKLAVYHMNILDKFTWKKTEANTDYLTNGGDFKNTGVELSFDRKVDDNWHFNLGISYSNPTSNENGEWEQCNSRFQGTAGVTYLNSKFTGNINWLYLGNREADYYLINGQSTSVPYLSQLNANFEYKPVKNQTFSLKLNNILDRKDSVNKYNNICLPFNYLLSYEYSF